MRLRLRLRLGGCNLEGRTTKENFFLKKKKRMCQKILRRQNKGDYCNEKIIIKKINNNKEIKKINLISFKTKKY